jgi:hypothetical protein
MSFTDTRSRCAHSGATSFRSPLVRKFSLWIGGLAFLATAPLAYLIPVVVLAVDEPSITRVEEDWQVEMATPNASEFAPQITTVISPRSDLDHSYAVFELNHATQPGFEAGGLQMQCWYGDSFIHSSRHMQAVSLDTPNEVITFTMAMSLSDRWLKFEIENGSSPTWGAFGKGLNGNLKQWWYSSLENLNQYNPQNSVDNSRVGFASYRVKKLQLKTVRYYSGDTLVRTDDTPKVVWEYVP